MEANIQETIDLDLGKIIIFNITINKILYFGHNVNIMFSYVGHHVHQLVD